MSAERFTRHFDDGSRKAITELFAWVSVHPGGEEGIVAYQMGATLMPLVGADRARMESFRGHAQQTALITGCPIRLTRFSQREVLEELP